jgi:hypothetical protein
MPPGAEPVRRSEAVVLERKRLSQGARGQVPSTCCEDLNDDMYMKTGASVWWLVATYCLKCESFFLSLQSVFVLVSPLPLIYLFEQEIPKDFEDRL